MATPTEAQAAVQAALTASGKDSEEATEQTASDPGEQETATEEAQEETSQTEEVDAEEGEESTTDSASPKTIPLRRFNEVYGRMKELERLVKDMAVATKDEVARRPAPEEELPDFDHMTSKDIAKWNLAQIKKTVQEVVNSSIGPVVNSSKEEKALRMIETAAKKYPDFYDYKEAIIEMGQRHPTLTPEEAYLLASGNGVAAKKAVAQRLQANMKLKKSAKTETRSTPAERTTEKTEFKNIKEAALYQAKKLGLLK